MGIGDFVEKAKDALGDHADQAGDMLDKAADAVKEHTPDAIDDKIDGAVDKAQDFLDKQ
ncbi:antitoxin [Actinotalea sp.]|uniref:antitoxin n=1 Tax=Actinotalea sp. TaxID=1872145 RepID=UPI00356201BC